MVAISFLKTVFVTVGLLSAIAAQSTDRTVKVHAWSLESANPEQLAEIAYNPESLTSSVVRFTKPSGSYASENMIRVGLYDAETSSWRGIVTSAATFDDRFQQKLQLHVDNSGDVWHVSIAVQHKPNTLPLKKGKKSDVVPVEDLVVEIVKPVPAPTPVLNKPVVLNAEGKVLEKEQEKSFLQKYWWIIGIVVLMQVMSAGGGAAK